MSEQEFLDLIKLKLGMMYSDPLKDVEVKALIEAARGYMINAGWQRTINDAFAAEAVALYCKMSLNQDPTAMTVNPMLVSLIAQGRHIEEVADEGDIQDGG